MGPATPDTEWDGRERRSGIERRSGEDRRKDTERRRRLMAIESTEAGDPQAIPSERWDRRSGRDRRGHLLYSKRG